MRKRSFRIKGCIFYLHGALIVVHARAMHMLDSASDKRFEIGEFRLFELVDPYWRGWTGECFVPSVILDQLRNSRQELPFAGCLTGKGSKQVRMLG